MTKAERTFWQVGVYLLAVAAVVIISPTTASAQTQTFDSAPADWMGALNGPPEEGGFGPYGFSNTNNTMGNAAGEAGGIFQRTPTRNYYADTTLDGTPSEAAGFSATGELFVGADTADNDVLVGHFEAKSDVVDELNHAGFILREATGSVPDLFRFMARIRGDGSNQRDGEAIELPEGAYEFEYAYDPGTRTLTAQLFPSGGGDPIASSTTSALVEGETFFADAFGLTGGFNGSGTAELTVFIDDVTYTSVIGPGVPGDYNGNGTVDAADYVLWREGGPIQNEGEGISPDEVDADDYTFWRSQFGNSGEPPISDGAAVPEPASIVMAIGAFVLCLLGRTHRPD